MKKARQLAKKNIQKTQGHQKKQYDQRAQDNNIHAGDLVMLKVELRFKLDQGYKGLLYSYVNEVTPTNATSYVDEECITQSWTTCYVIATHFTVQWFILIWQPTMTRSLQVNEAPSNLKIWAKDLQISSSHPSKETAD